MFKSEKNLLSEILRKQLQKFDYIEGDTDRQRSKTVYTQSQSEIKNVASGYVCLFIECQY